MFQAREAEMKHQEAPPPVHTTHPPQTTLPSIHHVKVCTTHMAIYLPCQGMHYPHCHLSTMSRYVSPTLPPIHHVKVCISHTATYPPCQGMHHSHCHLSTMSRCLSPHCHLSTMSRFVPPTLPSIHNVKVCSTHTIIYPLCRGMYLSHFHLSTMSRYAPLTLLSTTVSRYVPLTLPSIHNVKVCSTHTIIYPLCRGMYLSHFHLSTMSRYAPLTLSSTHCVEVCTSHTSIYPQCQGMLHSHYHLPTVSRYVLSHFHLSTMSRYAPLSLSSISSYRLYMYLSQCFYTTDSTTFRNR